MKKILPTFLLVALVLGGCNLPVVVGTPTVAAEVPTVAVVTAATTTTPNPASTQTPADATATGTASDYGHLARGYLEDLVAIGPRVAGTDQEAQAAQYIQGIFESFGFPTEVQEFTETGSDGETVHSANVTAVKAGRSSDELIVGAHYDSAAAGRGADDNASGVAVMLEAAQWIKDIETPYTIRFIAFGAEESGLLGSYAYLNQMTQQEFEDAIAMINLDSLAAGDIPYIYSDETQSALRDWVLEWAFGNGLDLQTIHDVNLAGEDGNGISDYAAFQMVGIPFVYFEATNWNLGDQDGYTQVDPQYGVDGKIWHTQYDMLEYLDPTFPGRVNQHLALFTEILVDILTNYSGVAP